jgi:hypothetical protein
LRAAVATLSSVGLMIGWVSPSSAAVVNSFGDLPGAVFHDLPPSGSNDIFGPVPINAGPATVTVTSSQVLNGGAGPTQSPAFLGTFDYSTFGPNLNSGIDPNVNPGNYAGEYENDVDLILDFDVPLTAAGVSLFSSGYGTGEAGIVVTAHAGPGATGAVVGSITSPTNPVYNLPRPLPVSVLPFNHVYFVGITADGAPIRSLRLQPLAYDRGLALDGIAVAVPEPALGLAIAAAALLLPLRRRR